MEFFRLSPQHDRQRWTALRWAGNSGTSLDAEEFLRRFCMHILPKGFMKIRHYGFLSSRARPQLRMQQTEMGVTPARPKNKDWQTIAREKLDFDVEQCPCCKTGKMITLLSFAAHGPPQWALKVIEQQKGVD